MRLARFALATATALVTTLARPAGLAAQTIDPGFTRAQVEQKFGPPAAARVVGEFTYLFYNNGCEISCGQHDLVALRNDRVTDAVLRGKSRTYSGRSSSPPGRPHQATPASEPRPTAPGTAASAPSAPSANMPAANTAVPGNKPVPTPGSGSAAIPKKP